MRVAVAAVAAMMGACGAQAQSAPAKPKVVLVELFTSEGCSSCPPADALLKKMNGVTLSSGQMVVGISEHVTYWNQLGWVDPFSNETYTSRQNGYGERFRLESVYTPQMVVNGERQMSGGDGQAVLKAILADQAASGVTLHIDAVDGGAAAKTMAVTFSLAGMTAKGVDVYAVVADDMASSSVLRGENSGHTLGHVSVARSMTKVATVKDAKTMTVSVPVPGVLKGQPETKRHLIVFAQESGQGKVLAVESKAL